MLTYDPDERITVEQALAHPYLKQLHFPDDEPVTEPVSAFDFDFEKYSLSKEDFKDLMYDEIMLYHSVTRRHSSTLKIKRRIQKECWPRSMELD